MTISIIGGLSVLLAAGLGWKLHKAVCGMLSERLQHRMESNYAEAAELMEFLSEKIGKERFRELVTEFRNSRTALVPENDRHELRRQ